MTRIITAQPATSRPVRIAEASIGATWETLLEAPDYSVPDEIEVWSQRDPANAARRIQPGQALIEAPLMAYNSDTVPRWIEIRILTEAGAEVEQGRIEIPPGETYLHPAPGQVLLKLDPTTSDGDRLQVRAETTGVISVTAAASVGGAEQDQPA